LRKTSSGKSMVVFMDPQIQEYGYLARIGKVGSREGHGR
jgi:hypothetical protein